MERFGLTKLNPRKNEKGEPEELGFNDFRHSRVVYAKDDRPQDRRALAQKMLHSKEMGEKYMRVLGDTVLREVEK